MIDRNGSPDDRLNPTILHHQIIYLNSELNKYKSKVRDYQEDYHYSQLEKLKIENSHLLREQQQITNQIEEMNHINLHFTKQNNRKRDSYRTNDKTNGTFKRRNSCCK